MSSPAKKKTTKKADDEVVTGWIPLKQLSDNEMDREMNQTLANMLPFRAPPLSLNRVLVATSKGLREGHAAQDHVVRDFDSRFKKTSNGTPLFTSGIFLKPPTLPEDHDDPTRKERLAAEKEEEFKKRGLDAAVEGAADEVGHLASELAQFTFNKFDLSRKAAGKDKSQEIQSLKGVDPSRIQQLLAHNIRSTAPEHLIEPASAKKRSNVAESRKKPRPYDPKPHQVLPSSPVLHYLSIPGREDPMPPYSFLADRLDDNYMPLPFIALAKGNDGDKETEAPLVLNPSPPETHLHVPGKEQSYFSVPATPPTLSLAAPREMPQEHVQRATKKDKDSRPKPLAPSTPPEASFFVPHREIPAMPQTHEPKTAGFGSFVATPVQERLELDRVSRHKGGSTNATAPAMLLPRTPAELTFDAPAGSELAKKLGNDKQAHRNDMFSLPPLAPSEHPTQEKLVSRKEVVLGARPKPVLPRTPAETKLNLPAKDESGAIIPPAGQFFSVPATPPSSVIEQIAAPTIIRSKRKQDDDQQKLQKEQQEQIQKALQQAEEESLRSGNGYFSPQQLAEKKFELERAMLRNLPRKKIDPGADTAPPVPLPPTPPETKLALPGKAQFTITSTLTNFKSSLPAGLDRSVSTSSSAASSPLQNPKINILTNVFGTPATPIEAPIQPEFVDLHAKNPQPKDPKPIIPPTPLENAIMLPSSKTLGENEFVLGDFKFSLPPTPPAAPIVVLPRPEKKSAQEGEPSETKTLLPPSPVDPKLEPLPPTQGVDMETEVAAAKKAQVFSLPATPPTMQLPAVSKLLPKTLREHVDDVSALDEPTEAELSLARSEVSTNADSESSDIPHFLRAKMKEIKKKERQEKMEEKRITDGKEGARPVIPHTPPETSYALPPPPKFTIQRASQPATAGLVRSDSANSSVFGGSTVSAGSHNSSSSVVISKKAQQELEKLRREQEKQSQTGEFFSMPSTPPDSRTLKPQISIVRKQPQSGVRDVMDTKPVIPSTPPDDFFSVPNINNNNKTKILEESKFFSLAPTPVTKPLKSEQVGKHHDPVSSFSLDERIPLALAVNKASTADAVSGQPPKLPTPQELSWGVTGIPDSPPKKGFDPAKDKKARDLREKEIEEYNVRQRQESDRIEKLRLERQIKIAEGEARKIDAAAKSSKRELTQDEAALKIQSLQRQRQARQQLGQLREKKERDEKLKENAQQAAKLEEELKKIEEEKKRLEAKDAKGEKLSQNDAAAKIQNLQRERAAKRELERLRQEKARELEEAKNENNQAAVEEELKRLEAQRKEIEERAKAENRESAPDEEALKIESAQRAAKKKLEELRAIEVARQQKAAEEAQNQRKQLEREVDTVSSELKQVDDELNELELASKSRPLTQQEKEQQQMLIKKKELLQEELDQLRRDEVVAKEEHEALAAEAKATKLESEVASVRDKVADTTQDMEKLKEKIQKENREATVEEKQQIQKLEEEKNFLEKSLGKLEDQHGAALEDARREEAEAQAAEADDQVSKLEHEIKEMEQEQKEIDEKAKREGRELTPEEISKKIQCVERQQVAVKELERRKAIASEKEKEIQKALLVAQIGELQRQEEDFLEIERNSTQQQNQLSPEQKQIREANKQKMQQIKNELAVLNYVVIQINPNVSSPATPPEQHHHPSNNNNTSNTNTTILFHAAASPNSSAIASNNHPISPLPPTPPEASHGLPIIMSNNNVSRVLHHLPLTASEIPDRIDRQPRRPGAERHAGAEEPQDVHPVLPSTPPDQSGIILPKDPENNNNNNKNFLEDIDKDDAAIKIQNLQRQLELALLKKEKADEDAAKAHEEIADAEAKLKALEEENRKMEEEAKKQGRELTPDEAARKIQCLQRQRAARQELERRKRNAETKQKEAEAAKAQQEHADAEHKLKQLEEEQRKIEEGAKGRELTPDEAARKIQCLQRQRVARKELEKRRSAANTKAAEASAQRARVEEQEAEEKLKELEEEQQKIDEAAKGRELTPDEAARKIQCLQRQRMARKELEQRRQAAAAKHAQSEALRAKEQEIEAEESLRLLEEELKKLEEKEKIRPLTKDEISWRMQCLEQQEAAKEELEARREIKLQREHEAAEAEATRIANLPVAGVHPLLNQRNQLGNNNNNNNNDNDDDLSPAARANRIAAQVVQNAAEESDRHFLNPTNGTSQQQQQVSINNNNNDGAAVINPSSRIYLAPTSTNNNNNVNDLRSASTDDDRISLPGLGNNNNSAGSRVPQPGDSRASSNLNGPAFYQPNSSTSAINFNNNNNNNPSQRQPEAAATTTTANGSQQRTTTFPIQSNNNRGNNTQFGGAGAGLMPSPIPIVIRRNSSGNASQISTPAQSNISLVPNQQQQNNVSITSRIINESGIRRVERSAIDGRPFAVEESPAPRPLEPGTVVRHVADAMPHADTLPQFASQLEVYFSTFDPSQMSSIPSIATAYRQRQRELWNFLRDRYETPGLVLTTLQLNQNNNNQSRIIESGVASSPSPSIRMPRTNATDQQQQQLPSQLPQLTPAMQRIIQQSTTTATAPTTPAVRSSQVPNATSSRIVFNNNNNNNSTIASAASTNFGRPTTPVLIRRGTNQLNTTSTTENNNNISNNASVISEEIVGSDQRPSTLIEDLALSEIMRMLRDREQQQQQQQQRR